MSASFWHNNLSRRSFIACSASILGLAALPATALADLGGDVASGNADYLWQKAVREATAAGEPIITLEDSSRIIPASYKSVAAETNLGSAFERLGAVAAYEVTNNQIAAVYDTWLYTVYGIYDVSHSTKKYTLIDQRRTMAVNYTATLKSFTSQTLVISCYAEFYYDGTGWLTL